MYDVGPEIETEHLLLRMTTPEDAERFHQIWNDPVVMKYIEGWRPSLEDARRAMTRLLQHWRDKGFGQWAVVHKTEGELIGYVGFKHLEQTPEIELLYGIDRPHWRKGYTTEAACACLRFVFENTGLDRIVAVAHPENVGSWRVMEKLGMRREKIARYYNHDLVYYAILRAEFVPGNYPYVVRKN